MLNDSELADGDNAFRDGIKKLVTTVWHGKWVIGLVTGIFSLFSLYIAVTTPNTYQVTMKLSPKEQSNGLMSIAANFGSLPGLSGLNFGGSGGATNAAQIPEYIRSITFFRDYLYEDVLVELMAAQAWDSETGELAINDAIYDSETGAWKRPVSLPFTAKPHFQEAHQRFLNHLSVNSARLSGILSVSISHISPKVAKRWADLVLTATNEAYKSKKVKEASSTIAFLLDQRQKTNLTKLDEIFAKLIEEQTKVQMLASSEGDQMFDTIQGSYTPIEKSGPGRKLICIVGASLGLLAGLLAVFLDYLLFSFRGVEAFNSYLVRMLSRLRV